MTNETLYGQMNKECASFGFPWTIFEASRNRTINGEMACDAILKANFIGGVGYVRLVVVADEGWKTAWTLEMSQTYSGPLHFPPDDTYRNSTFVTEVNSTIASLTVERQDATEMLLYFGFAMAIVFAMAAPILVKRIRHQK